MRRVSSIGAVCVALALGSAPAHAHGGPSGNGSQYPYWYTTSGTQIPPAVIRTAPLNLPHCYPDVTLLQFGNVGGSPEPAPRPGNSGSQQPPADAPGAGVLPPGSARMYVSDPRHSFPAGALAGSYAARVDMPYDATATGLHQDGKDLYLARDGRSVFLVGEHGVERWPAQTAVNLTCD